jgi:NAD(P)-dependent dehydrogenase (short-subunit alcohol dehydrogenase family)
MLTLVTGASRGIGKSAVESLAESGKDVIAVSRTPFENILSLPSRVHYIQADLSAPEGLEKIKEVVRQSGKKISALIHNAAVLINKPFSEISGTELEAVFRVNVFAPFYLTQRLLPFMEEGAHVVMISSMGGITGSVKFPGLSAYSSSKAALAVLAECLAVELKDRKIFFNSLHPGAVQTEMLENAFPGYRAPMSAKEMGNFVAWFALNGQRWFNGKCIPVSCSTP